MIALTEFRFLSTSDLNHCRSYIAMCRKRAYNDIPGAQPGDDGRPAKRVCASDGQGAMAKRWSLSAGAASFGMFSTVASFVGHAARALISVLPLSGGRIKEVRGDGEDIPSPDEVQTPPQAKTTSEDGHPTKKREHVTVTKLPTPDEIAAGKRIGKGKISRGAAMLQSSGKSRRTPGMPPSPFEGSPMRRSVGYRVVNGARVPKHIVKVGGVHKASKVKWDKSVRCKVYRTRDVPGAVMHAMQECRCMKQ